MWQIFLISEVMSGLPYMGGGGCKVVTKYTLESSQRELSFETL